MRLFTAIDLPEMVEGNLAALMARLRPAAGAAAEKKISWTRAANLHVTTKFIGEWPEDRLAEMRLALESVGSPGAIDISIRGIGWFPNARDPRVLWAGVEGGAELAALAHSIDAAVHAIGIAKEERPYTPHLTLARIRERMPLDDLRKAIDALESTDFGDFHAPAFYLYLSAGGRYTKLAEFELA